MSEPADQLPLDGIDAADQSVSDLPEPAGTGETGAPDEPSEGADDAPADDSADDSADDDADEGSADDAAADGSADEPEDDDATQDGDATQDVDADASDESEGQRDRQRTRSRDGGSRERRRPIVADPFAVTAVEANDAKAASTPAEGDVEDQSDDDEDADADGDGAPRRRRRRGRGRGRGGSGQQPQNQDDESSDDDSTSGADVADDAEDGEDADSPATPATPATPADDDENDETTATTDADGGVSTGTEAEGGQDGDGAPRKRRRRRGKRGGGGGGQNGGGGGGQNGGGNRNQADDDDDSEQGDDESSADHRSDGESSQDQKQQGRGGKGGQGQSGKGQKSQSKGGPSKGGQSKGGQAKDDASARGDGDDQDEDGQASGRNRPDDDSGDGEGAGKRRRRRGRRGRGRRGRGGDADAPKDSSGGQSADEDNKPTRLSARSQRTPGGRRRVPTVSPETRRAITESPPKRMLVTVGSERTQIAVLEERTLVEHYVTQESEASYVGNIYKGRVQNVLPGMEAAFIDIGKGRNGVLYAGEVNYDEADRDGGLPRIEQVLKSGQAVLVQVTKDPMGTKGARLTQHLSLAGRYCVLAPGDDMLGISRKLPDEQRDRLRKILKDLKPEGFGLIVRTAAESATAEQLRADVERLLERWKVVEEKAEKAKPLESIYAEPQLVLRVIRDVFGPEHTQLVIDDPELAEQVRSYLGEVSPEHVDKVVTYDPPIGPNGKAEKLFDAYEVTTQIRRALEKKVWLKSGGYLIIEKTEAMWVIDVNTGKFVGKDNLEETVLRNNIEAAEEIAKQLRLRDMGGIIVIDFVDMIVPANREEVLKRFKRELARDKTKSRVMEISKLGLVQMTRKNVSKGLMEAFTVETDDTIPGRRIVEDLLA